jgi:hypothetical protein
MGFNDMFRNGQAQTSAAGGSVGHLYKPVEEARQIFWWDTTAGIGHGDGDVAITLGCGNGNLTTALSMPHGIAHEVGDNALYL